MDAYPMGRIDNPHYNSAPLGLNMGADCDMNGSSNVPNGYLKERQDDNKSCYSNNSSPHTPDDLSSSHSKEVKFYIR